MLPTPSAIGWLASSGHVCPRRELQTTGGGINHILQAHRLSVTSHEVELGGEGVRAGADSRTKRVEVWSREVSDAMVDEHAEAPSPEPVDAVRHASCEEPLGDSSRLHVSRRRVR